MVMPSRQLKKDHILYLPNYPRERRYDRKSNKQNNYRQKMHERTTLLYRYTISRSLLAIQMALEYQDYNLSKLCKLFYMKNVKTNFFCYRL